MGCSAALAIAFAMFLAVMPLYLASLPTNKKLTTIVDGVSTSSTLYSLSSVEMQVQTGETDYNNDGTQDIKLTIYTKQ